MEPPKKENIGYIPLLLREQLTPQEIQLQNEISSAINMLKEELPYWKGKTLTGKRIRTLIKRLEEIQVSMYNIMTFNPYSIFTSMSIVIQFGTLALIRHSKNGGRLLDESTTKRIVFGACMNRIQQLYNECLVEYGKTIQLHPI